MLTFLSKHVKKLWILFIFQDSPVILFWQKGLSKRYKQLVLQMARCNENGICTRNSSSLLQTSTQKSKSEDESDSRNITEDD